MRNNYKEVAYKYSNWQKAERHGRSTLVGLPKETKQNIQYDDKYCDCCGNLVQKQLISLCQNTKELQFMGIGFPLYYIFFKYCIILMFIESICIGISSVSTAMDSNYDFCIKKQAKVVPNINEQVSCTSYYVYFASINQYLSKEVIILRIIAFVTTITIFIYMRDKLAKLIDYYDQRNTTFSDYSIILTKLPNKEQIRQSLNQVLHSYQVHSIVVIGTFDHIEKMQNQIQILEKYHKKVLQKFQNDSSEYKKTQEQLHIIQQKIQKLEGVFLQIVTNQHNLYNNDHIIPEAVIISLQTDQQKEQILQQLHNRNQNMIPKGWTLEDLRSIQPLQSPQPRQIIWHNLNISIKLIWRNRILGWIFTILILGTISTIFYFTLIKIASLIKSESQQNLVGATLLFYIFLIVIIFINKFILSSLLHKISHFQKYFTTGQQEYSFSLKYILSMFFTTAVMTVLVQAITKKNIYAHYFGVIESESVMILLNSLLIPLIWLINPWHIYARLRQQFYRNNKYISQDQANQIMQMPSYDLGKRYAQIVKLIWLVSLYQSLIPLGTFFGTFGLGAYYWIDKYNLLRKSSLKSQVSGGLTLSIMGLLQFSLVLKSCGDLFFDMQIRYQYSIVSIVTLIISVLYMVIPKNELLKFIHDEKFNQQSKRLSQCIKKLGPSYEDLHPVLGKKMTEKIKSLKDKYKEEEQVKFETQNSIKKQIIMLTESQRRNNNLVLWKKSLQTADPIKQSLFQKSITTNNYPLSISFN